MVVDPGGSHPARRLVRLSGGDEDCRQGAGGAADRAAAVIVSPRHRHRGVATLAGGIEGGMKVT